MFLFAVSSPEGEYEAVMANGKRAEYFLANFTSSDRELFYDPQGFKAGSKLKWKLMLQRDKFGEWETDALFLDFQQASNYRREFNREYLEAQDIARVALVPV